MWLRVATIPSANLRTLLIIALALHYNSATSLPFRPISAHPDSFRTCQPSGMVRAMGVRTPPLAGFSFVWSHARAPMKWPHHPNLRKRPPTPSKGRGPVQVRIRRAFIASGAEVLSSTQIYDWTHSRRRQMRRKKLPYGIYWGTLQALRRCKWSVAQ